MAMKMPFQLELLPWQWGGMNKRARSGKRNFIAWLRDHWGVVRKLWKKLKKTLIPGKTDFDSKNNTQKGLNLEF